MFDSNSDGVNIVNLNIGPTSTEIKLVTLNFFSRFLLVLSSH